jgi:hypothetical protein
MMQQRPRETEPAPRRPQPRDPDTTRLDWAVRATFTAIAAGAFLIGAAHGNPPASPSTSHATTTITGRP